VKRAEELQAMIEAGEDFAELARTYSEDVQTKEKGGDMGNIPEGLLPEIYARHISQLQPGQMSPPIADPFGVRILLVRDRQAEQSQTYEEMKETLKEMIRQQREQEKLTNWVTQRRQDTYIVIYLEELEG
jgi:parvulin-like peptidyl-prolyl isomerase